MQLGVIHIVRVPTANSFEVVPMDCDINKEFKDLGMSSSPLFAGLNRLAHCLFVDRGLGDLVQHGLLVGVLAKIC